MRRGAMGQPTLWFLNLQEFQICFKAPNDTTLIHIAEFLKQCPNLKKINDFTFTPYLFLESCQKPKIYDGSYLMNNIKNVKIMGYKNEWHELNLLEFFVRNAESLEELVLVEPRDPNATMFPPNYERIANIRRMCPKEGLIKFVPNTSE
ncbi:unnamed protein product [Microthlaspi erraticum]|uniref:FBD domain-containing protein n=1 Tax=Microthlaspi erraticum TaxID=1685480 RepID=A0A6D2K026_9BRAS|nr:unnamed protein product [Microthlaspi erraticum]